VGGVETMLLIDEVADGGGGRKGVMRKKMDRAMAAANSMKTSQRMNQSNQSFRT